MRGMQFEPFKPGSQRAPGGSLERFLHSADLVDGQLVGKAVGFIVSNWARANNLPTQRRISRDQLAAIPGALRAGFSTGMGDLNSRNCAVFLDHASHARQRFDMRIRPDAKIMRRDAAARFDRGCFGDDQSRAACRAGSQMDHLPVVRKAIGVAVHAHRRNTDPVAQGDSFDCLFISNFRQGQFHFHAKLSFYPGPKHLQMDLAHAGKQNLSGLLVTCQAQGKVFIQNPGKGGKEFFFFALFGMYGKGDDRRK